MLPTVTTLALSAEEQAHERLLLDHFARFWAANAGQPLRATYDLFIGATPLVTGTTLRESAAPALPGWWVLPTGVAEPGDAAILYLHGGGYGLGSAQAYRGLASQIAARTRTAVFVLDYPLAPEARFPAAPEAAQAAAHALAAAGVQRLAVVGDSAGGGLTLSVLASLLGASGGPRLAAGVAFSPWTDLSLSGASMTDPAVRDTLLSRDYLAACAEQLLGGADARHPGASPLFGELAGLPPLLLQVGTDELLLDDARRYAERAASAGVDVQLQVWQGLHHVFQLNVQELASARRALDHAAAFLTARLHG